MKNVKIEFCADHAQYFRPMLKDGFERPFIGMGCSESEAYQDAANQVCMSLDGEINLPKRKGRKRRGFAYYFGKEAAREIAKNEENELWVYCLIYLPELPAPEPIPARFLDYSQRVKLSKYNSSVSGLSHLHSVSDCRQYVQRAFGYVSPAEHVQRRNNAMNKARFNKCLYLETLETACQQTFGLPASQVQYKISGIVRDEFTETAKNELRRLNREMWDWHAIAHLHNNCLFMKTGKIEVPAMF